MADYRAIKGLNIQSVSSDNATIQLGDIWYNSTLGKIRVGKTSSASWASGGNMNTVKHSSMGAGTQTAGLAAGGLAASFTADSEEYDGSTWTEGNNLNQARTQLGGTGTQTAALAAAGHIHPVNNPTSDLSEEYDGTSWAEGNNLNTARYAISECGSQTAALAFSGHYGPPGYSDSTEEYDGTSWTEGGALGTARYVTGGFGTQTAAVCAAGFGAPGGALLANVEEYDGSSWSEVTDLPAVRGNGFAWGPSQSDGIYGSGGITNQSTVTNTVFTYDGTNWTATTNYPISTTGAKTAMAAPTSTGLVFGGGPPSIATTNEYTGPGVEAASVDVT